MARKIDWESYIGRRLKLRDLYVFSIVVRCGSMAKAAAQLGVSHPTVSETISDLEQTFGAQLFDRNPQGVEPTIYGDALLKRCIAVFDELRQSGNDIAFLADPEGGDLRVGCAESLSAAILPPIIERFSERYPRVILHVDAVVTGTPEIPRLRDRSLDLVLARMKPLEELQFGDDLSVEVLFNEKLVVVAGPKSRWARRHEVDLADLVHEPWILTPPDNWNYLMLAEAFRTRGLDMPKTRLNTLSIHLRTNLLASGRFLTALPLSVVGLYARPFSLKVLPLNLPIRPWPVAIVTLKNRTLSPVVDRFIGCAREVTSSMTRRGQARKVQT